MFFLNLTAGQFLLLFGSVSAVALALYFLDRSRRRQVVSTLRFWIAAEQPTEVVRRKRIQQPWSLLLQLLSMLLLLLAIAQLRLGGKDSISRDHVLLLDTSAWMNAKNPAGATLMDSARQRALAYLRTVPSGERVMLVRADALATPATAFESNRKTLEAAIAQSEPGFTSLNLDQALQFARKAQDYGGRRPGEIVFVGTGRVADRESAVTAAPPLPNLRVLPVADDAQNCGLRKIGLRRSPTDPGIWDIYVASRNYGTAPRTVTLALSFGGAVIGSQRLTLAPGADRESAFTLRTKAAGILEARLLPGDKFPDDDRATLELPALEAIRITAYTDSPESLRPLLSANPRVTARIKKPGEYVPNDEGLVILDRFRPRTRPRGDSIWIDPPASESPIPVKQRVQKPAALRWVTANAIGAGLRTRDARLDSASVFLASPGDLPVAEIDAGPIILARPGSPKMVVIGFDPAGPAMRFELATPVLFANILRWMAPDAFRTLDLSARSAGTVNVPLDSAISPTDIHVTREDGSPVPFTVNDRSLRFFSPTGGTIRVKSGDRESVYSLTLPEMWEAQWKPPSQVRRGLPAVRESVMKSRDIWQLLAFLGAAGLLAEWILFGRYRKRVRPLVMPTEKLRKAS